MTWGVCHRWSETVFTKISTGCGPFWPGGCGLPVEDVGLFGRRRTRSPPGSPVSVTPSCCGCRWCDPRPVDHRGATRLSCPPGGLYPASVRRRELVTPARASAPFGRIVHSRSCREDSSRTWTACELVKVRSRHDHEIDCRGREARHTSRIACSTGTPPKPHTSFFRSSGASIHEKESQREAHVSAKQASSGKEARLPQPHVRPRRPLHRQGPAPQGKAEAVRLIPAVRGRRAFDALRRHGTRSRAGALRITFHADGSSTPRLAFAIGRKVGPAVARNRARRRLRVIFAEIAHEDPHLVPHGNYLVAVHRLDFTNVEARAWLRSALGQLAP